MLRRIQRLVVNANACAAQIADRKELLQWRREKKEDFERQKEQADRERSKDKGEVIFQSSPGGGLAGLSLSHDQDSLKEDMAHGRQGSRTPSPNLSESFTGRPDGLHMSHIMTSKSTLSPHDGSSSTYGGGVMGMRKSLSSPTSTRPRRRKRTSMHWSHSSSQGGESRPSETFASSAPPPPPKVSLIKRVQSMSAMAARNNDEISYRRDVIDSAFAKKRSANVSDSVSASSAIDLSPTYSNQSSAREGVSFPPLSSAADVAATPLGSRKRQPLPKYTSVLEATHKKDSLSWQSTNVEFWDTMVKDYAPPLLQPTRSMKDRLQTMEERAMWNAHKMSHHRHHLAGIRSL
jgi:hypothetical protein